MQHSTEWVGQSWGELGHIRQARAHGSTLLLIAWILHMSSRHGWFHAIMPSCHDGLHHTDMHQILTERTVKYGTGHYHFQEFHLLLVVEPCADVVCLVQAVTFLVTYDKPKQSLYDITRDLCPLLSISQLLRISTMYWGDTYNTQTLSSEVMLQAACCTRPAASY